jgi:DNA-directed RNA polymerase alpha subunit
MSDEAVRRAWRTWLMDPTPENAQAWAKAQARTMSPPADVEINEISNMLTVRARKALERLGVRRLSQLAERSERDLLSLKNCGVTTVGVIREMLKAHGLDLKELGS